MLKRSLIWLLALCLSAAILPAQAAEPDGVVRATLSNGMRVVVVPNRLAPVASMVLNYLVGSNDSPPGFPGTAHALEHMMFRGTEGLDRDQLFEMSAMLGGNYNASTTENVTNYYYTVPAADLGVVLHAEALRMRGLTLSQADWEKERGAIEQEVSRNLSSPFYNYMAQAQAILFAGSPYENDALGTRPSFQKTDAALLRRFYDQWYAPNNAIMVVAGDVDPSQVLAQVEAAFGAIPSRTLPPHAPVALGPLQAQTINLPTNLPVGLVSLAYRMPGLAAKDFATADILADVLASQRGPVYALVPSGKALLARFSYNAMRDAGVGAALAGFPRGADPAPLLQELRGIFTQVAQTGVPAELVEAAKRQELAQLAFENDSIGGLARIWSRTLSYGVGESPQDLAAAYSAVTVEDVNRMARLLLDPERAVTAVLTPQPGGQPVAGAGFGGAESLGSPPDHPVVLPAWAAAALADLRPPPDAAPPSVSVLPNGLRLIVQPEHVGRTVSVFGNVRTNADLQEPPGQEGVSAVMERMFSYGTQTRDRLAFRKAVDDIAGRLDAGLSFSLHVLAPDFEAGMALLAENQLRPAFPEAGFGVVRGQVAQSLAGSLQSPDYQFNRAVARALVPADDKSLRQATPDTVGALQLADLRAYYAQVMRPDLATIVVVGDVTPEEAQRVVAAVFGGWQAPGAPPDVDLPRVGGNAPSVARVPDSTSLQDRVALASTVALPATSPDRYTLMLGNVILGGGFSSRLMQDLRVRTGYVYSVSSSLDWTRTRARHTVSFGADPDKVEAARQLVLRNIREMQANPVSDAELARAKAQALRSLPMQRASVSGIAGLYLRLTELGLPLDTSNVAAKRYMAITAQDIRQVFADWLRPEDLALVVKGPAAP